ncbi:hypothetical protein ACFL03_15005 [Thermodesulfobacteriota bacterium]
MQAPEATPAPFAVKRLLVLPFTNMTSLYGEDVSARCPVCGKVYTTGKIEDGATDMLTERLISLLKTRTSYEIIPTSFAQGARSDHMLGKKIELSERNLLVETGRDLGADAVMVGHLYRFKERVGTGYSADTTASVAFDLDFVRVVDGRLIWNSHFDETQLSLSENLLNLGKFMKRKGRFVTAEELAISGLEGMFETFPE